MAADHLARAARLEARLSAGGAWVDADLRRDAAKAIGADQMAGQQAEHADLYWVTADMVAQALDASHDVPGFVPADLPSPNGIACFGAPLPRLDMPPLDFEMSAVPRQRVSVPVWGLWWHARDEQRLAVDVITRIGDLPAPMTGAGQLQPIQSAVIPRDQGTIFEGLAMRNVEGWRPQPEWVGVLAFLGSMSHLMMMPTVAERRTLDARTGGAPRDQSRPDDLVTMVDLRPLRYVRTEDLGEGGRVYRHRWVVRGHWTHQPYGPSQSLRKVIWRESYIKGPEGAPLLAAEKVMLWRR